MKCGGGEYLLIKCSDWIGLYILDMLYRFVLINCSDWIECYIFDWICYIGSYLLTVVIG